MGILDKITEARMDGLTLLGLAYFNLVQIRDMLNDLEIRCELLPHPEYVQYHDITELFVRLHGSMDPTARNSPDEFTSFEINGRLEELERDEDGDSIFLLKRFRERRVDYHYSNKNAVQIPYGGRAAEDIVESIVDGMRNAPWRRTLAWLRDASAPVTKAFSGCDFTDVARSLLAWDVRENRIIIAPYRIDFLDGTLLIDPSAVTMIRDWTRRSYGTGFSYFLSERIPLSPDAEIASDQVSDLVARIQEEWLQ
jgi:hypothetical protein